MKTKRPFWAGSVLVVTVLLGVLALLRPAANAGVEPSPFTPSEVDFGMLALTRTQTAAVHVVVPPSPVVPPNLPDRAPCTMNLWLVDELGGELASRRVEVVPGQTASLELNGRTVVRRGRQLVRAVVEVVGDGPCVDLLATFEIYDTRSGRTDVLYAPYAVGF